jgi:hypothetical protein
MISNVCVRSFLAIEGNRKRHLANSWRSLTFGRQGDVSLDGNQSSFGFLKRPGEMIECVAMLSTPATTGMPATKSGHAR